jgi:hypothetical protein
MLPKWLSQLAFHPNHQVPTVLVGMPAPNGRIESWLRGKDRVGIKVVGLLFDADEKRGNLVGSGVERLGFTRRIYPMSLGGLE